MKKRTMITAAFAALLAIATVGTAVTANAADNVVGNSLAGKGTVTVEQGKADGSDPVDPENPVDPITPVDPVNPTPDNGTLLIQQVSQLRFANITTGTTATSSLADSVTVNAPTVADPTVTADTERGNFIQFTDIRDGVYGYKVSAAMTKQFTKDSGTETLAGSSISFSNPMLNSVQPAASRPTALTSTFTLKEDGASTTVLNNPIADNLGKGTYTIEFGQSDDYDPTTNGGQGTAGTAADSVKLAVPANTRASMTTGSYTAEITWTIGQTPD